MPPRFDPTKMAALRIAKGWSLDDLARKSGIHESTLARWERGVNAPQGRNLGVLAKSLGADPASLLALDEPKPPKTGMRRASRLDDLRPFDRDDGEVRWDGEVLQQLTTRMLNRVKSSYALYADEKRKFWFEGTIAREHGLPPDEAAALGTRSGVGARFLFARKLAGNAEFGVTVHSHDPKLTLTLLDLPDGQIVRVALDVVTAAGAQVNELAFSFFDSQSLRPFALRVIGVVSVGGRPKAAKTRRET